MLTETSRTNLTLLGMLISSTLLVFMLCLCICVFVFIIFIIGKNVIYRILYLCRFRFLQSQSYNDQPNHQDHPFQVQRRYLTVKSDIAACYLLEYPLISSSLPHSWDFRSASPSSQGNP